MIKKCLVSSTAPGLVPAPVSYILSRQCPQLSVGPLAPLLSLTPPRLVPRPALASRPAARRSVDRHSLACSRTGRLGYLRPSARHAPLPPCQHSCCSGPVLASWSRSSLPPADTRPGGARCTCSPSPVLVRQQPPPPAAPPLRAPPPPTGAASAPGRGPHFWRRPHRGTPPPLLPRPPPLSTATTASRRPPRRSVAATPARVLLAGGQAVGGAWRQPYEGGRKAEEIGDRSTKQCERSPSDSVSDPVYSADRD